MLAESGVARGGAVPHTIDTTSSDAVLLAHLRAGDLSAFDLLFRRHYQTVYRVLYPLLGDEAGDVAQQVFLRLYRRPPKSCGTSLSAWLHRVALNLGYNTLRSRRRQERYEGIIHLLSREMDIKPLEREPEVRVAQEEMKLCVRAALARLKKRQAAILVLRYSGQSYREIAEALGVSPSSVGTLLARAERAFRAVYEGGNGGVGK